MNCTDIEAAIRTMAGTARSMGIDIVGLSVSPEGNSTHAE